MRWEEVNSTPEHETYHLYKGDKKQLQLIFSPFAHSLRIECNQTKRIFFVRREGFLRNRTVVRNEYGIKVGEFGQENRQHYIIVNEEKFFYSYDHSGIVLFKESKEQPFVSCSVQLSKDNSSKQVHPGLLMTLCWYLFLPVAKENVAELAVS